MDDYHVRLVMEYFLARPRAERTAATLTDIVTHIATTYALSAEGHAQLRENAVALARRRRLLPQETS